MLLGVQDLSGVLGGLTRGQRLGKLWLLLLGVRRLRTQGEEFLFHDLGVFDEVLRVLRQKILKIWLLLVHKICLGFISNKL